MLNESLLRNETSHYNILLELRDDLGPSRLHYVLIPTLAQNHNHQVEMARYCSPEPNCEWKRLNNLQHASIWVLEFKTFPFSSLKKTQTTQRTKGDNPISTLHGNGEYSRTRGEIRDKAQMYTYTLLHVLYVPHKH
jgi:hypothetical protein